MYALEKLRSAIRRSRAKPDGRRRPQPTRCSSTQNEKPELTMQRTQEKTDDRRHSAAASISTTPTGKPELTLERLQKELHDCSQSAAASVSSLPSELLQMIESLLCPRDKASLRATSTHMFDCLFVRGRRTADQEVARWHYIKFDDLCRRPKYWNIDSRISSRANNASSDSLGSARRGARNSKQCLRRVPLCPHRSLTQQNVDDFVKDAIRRASEGPLAIEAPLECRVPSCRSWTRNMLVPLTDRTEYLSQNSPIWVLCTVVRCLRVRVATSDISNPLELLQNPAIRIRRHAALSALALPVCQHLLISDQQIANSFPYHESVKIDDKRDGAPWNRAGTCYENGVCKLCRDVDSLTKFWWFCQVSPTSDPGIVWFDFNLLINRELRVSSEHRQHDPSLEVHCHHKCSPTKYPHFLPACALRELPEKWWKWAEASSTGDFDWRRTDEVL